VQQQEETQIKQHLQAHLVALTTGLQHPTPSLRPTMYTTATTDINNSQLQLLYCSGSVIFNPACASHLQLACHNHQLVAQSSHSIDAIASSQATASTPTCDWPVCEDLVEHKWREAGAAQPEAHVQASGRVHQRCFPGVDAAQHLPRLACVWTASIVSSAADAEIKDIPCRTPAATCDASQLNTDLQEYLVSMQWLPCS
jgi:hypothetical protein